MTIIEASDNLSSERYDGEDPFTCDELEVPGFSAQHFAKDSGKSWQTVHIHGVTDWTVTHGYHGPTIKFTHPDGSTVTVYVYDERP